MLHCFVPSSKGIDDWGFKHEQISRRLVDKGQREYNQINYELTQVFTTSFSSNLFNIYENTLK